MKGGFTEYDTPQEFRDRLRLDLRAFIHGKLNEGPKKLPPQLPLYRDIAKALSDGRVVPIIGTDVSHSGRPAGTPWNPQAPEFLPNGVELSECLADDITFPSEKERDQLAEVAFYYETRSNRDRLRHRLRRFLGPDALAGAIIPPLYRFLAEVQKPLLIITANYDIQLERAFQDARKPYDLVVYGADRKDLANAVLWWPAGATEPKTLAPNELDIDLETTTVIFKMHGSILPDTDEWDSFVITETDYVEFLSRVKSRSAIPATFFKYCRDRRLLFLGYNLRDWNSRTILESLSRLIKKRSDDKGKGQWVAINEHFSELEKEFWWRRGVVPCEVGIDAFVEKLRTEMPT